MQLGPSLVVKKGAKPSQHTMPNMTTRPLQAQRKEPAEHWTRSHQRKARGRRQPHGSVGRALVLPTQTDCLDCRWWFESLLVHSKVSSATRRKATGADHKKRGNREGGQSSSMIIFPNTRPHFHQPNFKVFAFHSAVEAWRSNAGSVKFRGTP